MIEDLLTQILVERRIKISAAANRRLSSIAVFVLPHDYCSQYVLSSRKVFVPLTPLLRLSPERCRQLLNKMNIKRLIIVLILTSVSAEAWTPIDKDLIELKTTWAKFANGLLRRDFKSLNMISNDTIFCPLCAENSKDEQDIMNKIRTTEAYPDTLYNYLAKIPFDKFYREDIFVICNESVIQNLIDETKVSFSILDSKRNIYEVHVIVLDAKPGITEGLQYDFQFQKTDIGYRLIAFYTTP